MPFSGAIDLVWLSSADPLLLREISRSARRLYGDRDVFEDFQYRAFKKYGDYRPFLDRERELLEKRLEKLD